MGKPAGRLGDIGSGHGKCSPTPITSGSGDVTINGKPAARVGDSLKRHCKHGRSIAAGSSSVTINGRPAARVGDAIACGGKVAAGSGDVTIGDAIVLTKTSNAALPDIDFTKQRGTGGQYKAVGHTPGEVSPGENVTIDHELTSEEALAPEFKPATIRLAINPASNLFDNDQFVLTSTDGAISVTKTVADDLIPGDDFLDLKFDGLDTSKNYKLEHVDGSSGSSYTYFKSFSYAALGVQSRPADDDDDEEDENQ
ncbi:MAG: PAAR domain-containing protein [Cellvibrionaceae bacterium]